MASRAELETELEKLDENEFYIQMIDHWTASDYEAIRDIRSRRREVKKLLDEMR